MDPEGLPVGGPMPAGEEEIMSESMLNAAAEEEGPGHRCELSGTLGLSLNPGGEESAGNQESAEHLPYGPVGHLAGTSS